MNYITYKVIEDDIEYDVSTHDGIKTYYLNNLRHRENGPAVEYSDGTKVWCKFGYWHREDGPARIFCDGQKEYWFNDRLHLMITSDEQWLKIVNELIIKEIIE
jgi:hypothetical protein